MFLKGLGLDQATIVEVPLTTGMLTNYGLPGWNPEGITDTDYLTGGWNSDGYNIDKYFVIDLGTPKNIIEAEIFSSTESLDDMWTNAVFGIDYSDDGSTWNWASQLFSIESGQDSSKTTWASLGAHQYWRVYIVQSKVEDGNTDGHWIGGLKLYEEVITTIPDIVEPQPEIVQPEPVLVETISAPAIITAPIEQAPILTPTSVSTPTDVVSTPIAPEFIPEQVQVVEEVVPQVIVKKPLFTKRQLTYGIIGLFGLYFIWNMFSKK